MSESTKAELLFRYTRDQEGLYHGSAQVIEHCTVTGDSARPPLQVAVHRPEWIEFVVSQIKQTKVDRVGFVLSRSNAPETTYVLGSETVSKIKCGALRVTDLIL